MNYIIDIVKEKGVAKLIISYKKRFEWAEIIQKYTIGNNSTTDWVSLSKNEELEEDFIHEFRDDVSWLYVCIYQSLSERFIERHKSYILWRRILWEVYGFISTQNTIALVDL